MKKIILIIIAAMSGLLLPQTAKSQLQLSQKLDYSNPPLKYYRITDNVRYTEVDFSKQKIITEENGKYSVKLPFVVSKAAPAGELFWLLLYVPNDSKFKSWGIYTANDKFICTGFYTFRTSDAMYLIQTQDNLTQKVTAGNYYLRLTFSAKPVTKDIKVSVAYSTQEVLNEFVAILNENQIPAPTQKPAEAPITKNSRGETIIPNVANQPAANNNAQSEKGVNINGVIWATRNVGEPGKFADKPQDRGILYNWNDASKICPDGWRLPTQREFMSLRENSTRKETKDGWSLNGGQLFFSFNEKVGTTDFGNYWSSNTYNSPSYNETLAYYLQITNDIFGHCNTGYWISRKLAVRCVKSSSSVVQTSTKASTTNSSKTTTSSNTQREKKPQDELVGTTWKDGDLTIRFWSTWDDEKRAELSSSRWKKGTIKCSFTFDGSEGKVYFENGSGTVLRIRKSGNSLTWKCTAQNCKGFEVPIDGKDIYYENGTFYKQK